MATLLHIDSSPLGSASVSRELAEAYVTKWKTAHSDGTVVYRDLASESPEPLSAAWIVAAHTSHQERTEEQKKLIALSDTLIDELEKADEYVVSSPMHNFAIASTLKLWIDQIVRAGRTFRYGASGPEGLLKGKKLTLLIATGGVYTEENGLAHLNFVESYLRTVFGFIGVQDVQVVTAGGTAALLQGADRTTFLAPFLEQTRALTV